MKPLLAGATLLLAMAGCDRCVEHPAPAIYAPWEAGLTLGYINPSQPEAPRLQVRVAKSEPTPRGTLVRETFTTLSGESEATILLDHGRVAMLLDPASELTVLPEGFPDKVDRWVERGTLHRVIGRARVDLPGVRLPDPDATGVWIESIAPVPGAARRRTLVVPDFGEVETLVGMDGRWVPVMRLVSQGFTDPPKLGSAR